MQKLIPLISLIGGLWVIAAVSLVADQPLVVIAGGVIATCSGLLGLGTVGSKTAKPATVGGGACTSSGCGATGDSTC